MRRAVFGTSLLTLATAAHAQLTDPPQNVQVDAYDRGLVIRFEPGPDWLTLRVSRIAFIRDDEPPVTGFGSPIIEGGLEPETTYQYEIYGVDSLGTTRMTESAFISATTRPAGEGITTVRLTKENGLKIGRSAEATVSADGRFVAFITRAEELIGETTTDDQIVLHDRDSGQFSLISRKGAAIGNGDSASPSISADGRYVAFVTESTNLGSVDTPAGGVLLFDRESGLLTLVSEATDGNGANRACVDAAISDDGSTVAFVSNATNLIAGSTDDRAHVYVADLDTMTITRITTDGVSGSLSHDEFGAAYEVALNGDGSLVAYRAGFKWNFNTSTWISGQWLYDRASGETEVITARPDGRPADGVTEGVADMTPDGRYVAFFYRILPTKPSEAILPGIGAWGTIYLLDRTTGTYEFVARPISANGNPDAFAWPTDQYPPTISDDGRIITFTGGKEFGFSQEIGSDVYIRDRDLLATIQASRSSLGIHGEGWSEHAVVSGDGSVIIYQSYADNLVEDDTNAIYPDLFATELSVAPPDPNPPTWPENSEISVTNLGATLAGLTWTTAEDAEGNLAGYRVYLDGVLAATTGPTVPGTSLTGLSSETTYMVSIEAFDAAGNSSTDGPEIEIRTSTLVIGEAGLTGPALEGGRVNLTWDPSESNVAAYAVERRIGAATEWTEIAEVAPDVTSFADQDLPASTSIAYRIQVRFIGETEKNLHTSIHTITTPDLYLSDFEVDLPFSSNSRQALQRSGSLALKLQGEPDRTAEATVEVLVWPDPVNADSEPIQQTVPIPLTENQAGSGLYEGIWILPENTASVIRIDGRLTDGVTTETMPFSSALPRGVEAQLEIPIDLAPGFAGEPPDLLVSIWSQGLRAGQTVREATNGSFIFPSVAPADDYQIKVYLYGELTDEYGPVLLRPGLLSTRPHSVVEPPRSGLRLAIRDPNGRPVRASVAAAGTAKGRSVRVWGATNVDGVVNRFINHPDLVAGTDLTVQVSRTSWDLDGGSFEIAVPEEDSLVTLTLDWSPIYSAPGDIEGVVRKADGTPAQGAVVTAVSNLMVVNFFQKTSTDSEGRYRIDGAQGSTRVEARLDPATDEILVQSLAQPTAQPLADTVSPEVAVANVDVEPGGLVQLDFNLEPTRRVRVSVESLTLVDASGVERAYPNLANLPNLSQIEILAGLADETFSLARSRGSSRGLELEFDLQRGRTFQITIDASSLGYEPEALDFTLGDDDLVVIPSVSLSMNTENYVVAQLLREDGSPLRSGDRWVAQVAGSGGGVVISSSPFQWSPPEYHGSGPRLMLPFAGSGNYKLRVYSSETDDEARSFDTSVDVVGVEGENDLGTITLLEGGILKSAPATRFYAQPNVARSGDTVRMVAAFQNKTHTLTNLQAELVMPEALSVVADSAILSGKEPKAIPLTEGGRFDLSSVVGDLGTEEQFLFTFDLMIDPENTVANLPVILRAGYLSAGENVEESVGSQIIQVILQPTLQGPGKVSTRAVELSGRSPAGKIRIYDEGEFVGETTVSRYGFWSIKTELARRKAPYWHRLTAVNVREGGNGTLSEPLDVLHHPLSLRPTRVTFRQAIEEARTNREKRLAALFPSVGEIRAFDVPDSGVARLNTTMLAGIPFDFTVEFSQPLLVTDLSVYLAGPVGGSAEAIRGDDGLFRARIRSPRDARWEAGPISLEYSSAGRTEFPRWGNLIEIGDPEPIDDSLDTQEAAENDEKRPAADEPADQSWRWPVGSTDGLITGSIDVRIRSVEGTEPRDTDTVVYPNGSISYARGSGPSLNGSVDWTLSGNTLRFTVDSTIPASRFIDGDESPPGWPSNSAISLSNPTASSITASWTPGFDDMWLESYRISLDGELVGEIPVQITDFNLDGLQNEQFYTVSLQAVDIAGKTSGESLELYFQFRGGETVAAATTIARDEKPQTGRPPGNGTNPGSVTANEDFGDQALRLTETVVLNLPAIEVLATHYNLLDWRSQLEDWQDMEAKLDECGASPLAKSQLDQAIAEAQDSLQIQNLVGTVLTSTSVAAAATGVGAAPGAALYVGTVGVNYFLDDAADRDNRFVDTVYQGILAELECEEEEEEKDDDDNKDNDRDPKRRRVADPIWKIDPSGFVYEVIEDNRLEGVTATLLEGESENGPWVVSDAEAFGEINPLTTVIDGAYRWDVPAGWWQVMYEKEGYETAFSDVLPVPPPHFDVNIPLKSLTPPEVLGASSLNNGAALRIDFANYIRATMAGPDTVRLRDDQGDLLPGLVYAPDEELVDNPHTESTTRDIARRLLIVPQERLNIGETYTLEVDGVMESYGEVPLGETVPIEITIADTFTGTWFGTFAPGNGLWSMQIDDDGQASLLGLDSDTGQVFRADGTVDEAGNLAIDLGAFAPGAQLTGTLTDGSLDGSVSILGTTMAGSRSQGGAASEAAALTYHGAVVGSSGTTVTVTVGPDGTLLALIDGELTSSAALGQIDETFSFSGLLSDGSELELDLSDPDGGMSGVLSLVDRGSWSILGAEQSLPNARLVNVSGRGPIGSGGSLIAGFVIRGSAENPMLIRAIGPGLETFGVEGRLEKPRIRLVDQSKPAETSRIAENANWLEAGNRNELRAVFAGLGAFFLEDASSDATVYLPVTPGPYTAVVQGLDGLTGITLVEAYDADLGVFGTTSQGVANLSLRGQVGTGSGVMIAGFVIEGNAPRRLLLRGIGPGLGTLGVAGFLGDPEITLFQGGDPIAENQSWGDALPNEGLAGLFPLVGAFALESGSADAALVIWLAPGPYTLRLRNEVIGQGVGLIEIYDMP